MEESKSRGPIPPKDLDAEGLAAFRSTVKDLKEQGTLHKTDVKLITLYARTCSIHKRIENQLSTEDLKFDATNGRAYINPLVNAYSTYSKTLQSQLNDLGLTHKTRKTEDKPEDDGLDDFINGRQLNRLDPIPPDLITNDSDRKAIEEGCYFDDDAWRRVVKFIESYCCHTKGRWYGKPFRLLKWQVECIRRIYGWKRADGFRRFRHVYIEIPKKNGKTELVAALVIYHLMADGENAAEIYLCAYTREQAGLVFKDAKMMRDSSPALRKRLEVRDSFHFKTLKYKPTRSVLTVLSSDAPSADGKSSSFTCFDELHRQETPEHFNVMEYAGTSRTQPILMSITTSGVDRLSVCYQQHDYTERINSSADIDTSFFGVIYGCDPEKDDLDDPALWERVNPGWGETVNPQDFAQEHARAKANPTKWNNFIRLRLNAWTQADSRFLDRDQWVVCGKHAVDPEKLRGQICYAGLDLSNVSDITALVLHFACADGTHQILPFFWLPEEYANLRHERDNVPYPTWKKEITFTSGYSVDYSFIKAKIHELSKTYKIKKLFMDPAMAPQIALQLAAEGLPIEYYRQGFISMNAPCKEFIRLVTEGSYHHGNNPVLNWMVDNARAVTDPNENIKISKKMSKDKVDGLVAGAMALAACISDPPEQRSVYSSRGLTVF